ncbi:sensor histidine kinase [Salisediminibacterium halotolerans]|uniref:histidine kinase n=1 Tax=Salisediminibacterium halotolerans TaxID=517425 RepID=A0A1H9VZ65_9BACI|nr:HAMP domain-containing sensor histidine kinase [Salisediminibacterium haloalkalitolerans]SES27016.1 HAMP domain-containing protein [Salisediminibacterium haloalkalitolerans]
MKNKLSLKIGLLFFVFILIIESILFIFLYFNLVNDRVDELLDGILIRGDNHRDVLEQSFTEETVHHVAVMETNAPNTVAITDEHNRVIESSEPVTSEMASLMAHTDTGPHEGRILSDDWRNDPYVVSESPIVINDEIEGYVYMLSDAGNIRTIINQLTNQFILAGILTLALTAGTIFLLTRFITAPIVRMREATERMSKGELDITLGYVRNDELGELEFSIRKLAQDLEKVKQERNDFLASIAHELRTPLTYLKGYADMAGREATKEKDRAEYLVILKEEAEQLNKLVNNLFELAKLDQNTFSIEKQRLPIRQPIDAVAKMMEPLLKEKGITLNIRCPEDLYADIDPERFQQVILNLVDNAVKYSHPSSAIQIIVAEGENEITINVSDQGEGIAKHHLPYLFDRLYRVDKSRSREFGGSGIGLAIVKKIIEAHGGSIEAKSVVGKGTEMIISLKKTCGDMSINE